VVRVPGQTDSPGNGAHGNRARKLYRSEDDDVAVQWPAPLRGRVQVIDPEPLSAGQASWACLPRQAFGVDPLACPRCSTEMRIVPVITTPAVIDQVLRHVRKTGKDNLWGPGPLRRRRSRRTYAIRGSAGTGRGGDGLFHEGRTGLPE